MKCPHCEYEHGYNSETSGKIIGEEGDFFKSPVTVQRDSSYYNSKEERSLYVCPSCNKTFIDRW